MKSRMLLNLLLLALVVGLGLFAYLRPRQASQPEFALSATPPADVRRIAIAPQDQPTVKLEKRGREWFVAAPFRTRADAFKVEQVLGVLGARSKERLAATDLARFGLDKPLLTLTLERQVFRFAGFSPISQKQYVGDGNWVYLVDPRYFAAAAAPAADYASKQLLAAGDIPVGFDFPALKLTRVRGRWSANPARPELDQDRLNQFAQEWQLASGLVTQPYSGGKALEHILLHLSDGRGIPIAVLGRKPELVLLREDENMEYHFPAQMGARLLDPARGSADGPEVGRGADRRGAAPA